MLYSSTPIFSLAYLPHGLNLNAPFQIKICGITNTSDAEHVCHSGADAIGLNFYPPSRRYISPEQAVKLSETIRNIRPEIKIIGVFVNESLGEVIEVANSIQLDGIQLHGDEGVRYFNELDSILEKQTNRPFIGKAIGCQPADEMTAEDKIVEFEILEQQIGNWQQTSLNYLLIDAVTPGEYGGTGKTINWTKVQKWKNSLSTPIVLAGGLNPENVGQAIQKSGVQSVDVASGVETSPGQKGESLVRQFVQHAQTAFQTGSACGE